MAKKKAKSITDFSKSLMPAKTGDILELDEQWSFYQSKKTQIWLWIALCRRTKQVITFYLGDRTIKSFDGFYNEIPPEYAAGFSRSDKWQGYKRIHSWYHKRCHKKEGETNNVEGFNNILRQRIARLTRKTCAFSKSIEMHKAVLKIFLYEYNNEIKSVKR
ncbi:MAG: IS1 family transposase [Nanoarchaeota archaeon]